MSYESVLGNSTEQVTRLEYNYNCDNFGFITIETQLYISLSVQQHKYEFIHIKKLRLNITNKLGCEYITQQHFTVLIIGTFTCMLHKESVHN